MSDMHRAPKTTRPRDLMTYGTSRAVRHLDGDYTANIDIHVTLCAERGAPFSESAVAAMVCKNVEHYSHKLCYVLHGYCLMPDHLHVLLSPSESNIPLSDWLRDFKSFTTHEFVKLSGKAPLWQRSGYDHICREAETAETVLAYLADNPVRRGLVDRWDAWAWTRVFIEI